MLFSKAMLSLLRVLLASARASFRTRHDLVLENLALRQQLALFKQRMPHPRVSAVDRVFWAWLSQVWLNWRRALVVVKPETVVGWHRKGFRLFWKWKSRATLGRPRKNAELRRLIAEMARDNLSWGAPRIHGELLKLGFFVAQSTVARYMPRRFRRPPSQSWRTFLNNHLSQAAGIDFFTIPSATFRVFYGFVVLDHGRRRIRHMNVTEHPTAAWTRQQLLEAFPFDAPTRFLHRDRDTIFNGLVRQTIAVLGIDEILSAPKSPWQNPFAERVIGSLRRELLDHVIVLGEDHARQLLRTYRLYYNGARTHLSLSKDSPDSREIDHPKHGTTVAALPVLGGLHHRYRRRAA
jgi:transposase InsO family protein